MNNFVFYNPTKIIFGKGTIAQLPQEIEAGTKVLMTYGGGSISVTVYMIRLHKPLMGMIYWSLAV